MDELINIKLILERIAVALEKIVYVQSVENHAMVEKSEVKGQDGNRPSSAKPVDTDSKTKVEEEMMQDLEKCTIMVQTDKAILVVKNGYQIWVPKQYLPEEEYVLGCIYDLRLTKDGKWVTKKAWDKYVPMKGG